VDCLFDPKVNVATYNIGRQPGSSFKPFVYATAFEKGYNDKTIVVDELTDFGVWGGKHYIPQNYDGLFRGPITLRSALAQSLNIPSVKVLAYLAGQQDSIETAKKMGINLAQPDSYYGLSIVLGGGEVRLLDMVSAYGVFATEGLRYPPAPVIKIEDSQGNVIEENKKTPKRVLSPETCRLISDILSDNEARSPIFGLHSALYFDNYQVAAKTGTTTDYKDGWNIGYTPSIVAGVWAGNSDNTPINRKTGAMIASPIWHEFMAAVLPQYPKESFNKPAGQTPAEIPPSPNPSSSPQP
jgi:membrane peptidoglycan carboxypeptidase